MSKKETARRDVRRNVGHVGHNAGQRDVRRHVEPFPKKVPGISGARSLSVPKVQPASTADLDASVKKLQRILTGSSEDPFADVADEETSGATSSDLDAGVKKIQRAITGSDDTGNFVAIADVPPAPPPARASHPSHP
jgi:hypothetical protein